MTGQSADNFILTTDSGVWRQICSVRGRVRAGRAVARLRARVRVHVWNNIACTNNERAARCGIGVQSGPIGNRKHAYKEIVPNKERAAQCAQRVLESESESNSATIAFNVGATRPRMCAQTKQRQPWLSEHLWPQEFASRAPRLLHVLCGSALLKELDAQFAEQHCRRSSMRVRRAGDVRFVFVC